MSLIMSRADRRFQRESERQARRAAIQEYRAVMRHNNNLRADHRAQLEAAGTDWVTMELPGKMLPVPHAPGKRRFGGSSSPARRRRRTK